MIGKVVPINVAGMRRIKADKTNLIKLKENNPKFKLWKNIKTGVIEKIINGTNKAKIAIPNSTNA